MAEALAVFSLVSSIAQLIDFSAKVVSRLKEVNSRVNDTPQSFRSLAVQLPIMTIILQKIKNQALTAHVDDTVVDVLRPIIDECKMQAEYLSRRLLEFKTPESSSSLERWTKALKSLAAETRVRDALDKLQSSINVLVLHQTTTGIDISSEILDRVRALGDAPTPDISNRTLSIRTLQAASLDDIDSIYESLGIEARSENGKSILHTAVENDQVQTVRELCRSGRFQADLNCPDDKGQTPLHYAISTKNLEIAACLWQHGAKNDIKDNAGKLPLEYAENPFWTLWQLHHGTYLESTDSQTGNTALIQASCRGDLDTIQMLLRLGAKVDATNDLSNTALAEACTRGKTSIIEELLKHGADPNKIGSENWSPFTLCIVFNQCEAMLQLLKTKKVEIEATYTYGRHTALVEATYNSQWDMAVLLLEHGANPNAEGEDGPLLRHVVEWCRDEKVLLKFLERGANVHATNRDGLNAMTEAVDQHNWIAMELLLQHGASPNGTHETFPYLSKLVMWNVDARWFRALIKHGARLEAGNPDGWTPLREAAYYTHATLLHELLEAGANANNCVGKAFDKFGQHRNVTILMAAIWGGDRCETIIHDLLAHGARLEDKDDYGWTALRLAIENDHVRVACMLLSRGADPYSRGINGQTVIEMARKRKRRTFYAMVDAAEGL